MVKAFLLAFAISAAVQGGDAAAKEVPAVVAKATAQRDAARRAVLAAQVTLAKAKAALAEAQLGLTQAKYDAGAGREEAERE